MSWNDEGNVKYKKLLPKRKMQLTYFETSMVATGDSEQEAMNNVALDMLKVRV